MLKQFDDDALWIDYEFIMIWLKISQELIMLLLWFYYALILFGYDIYNDVDMVLYYCIR